MFKSKPARRQLKDSFDDLTDDEFERKALESLDPATTKISLPVPKELLGRTKDAAERRGVPHQSLIKPLIDQGVRRLERDRRGTH